ncbi:MAG TPA: helix-turn-helix domain-containing protein [Actinomycetota bacterium]|nr:helix-turn-helix domain-containing protein [Actinomycetota bacterium]
MEGFSADEACRYTGCTPHQLRYWDRIGLVRPSIQQTRGRPGVRRLYSFRDIVVLKAVRTLLSEGMSLQKVRKAYDFLRKRAALEQQLSEVKLISDGRSVFKVGRREGEIEDALKEGQLAFFIKLEGVAAGVDGKVSQYLYDREEFIKVVKMVEDKLKREFSAPQVRRVSAAAR